MSTIVVQNIYYSIAILAFVWMARRYRQSAFVLFLLCAGFEGTLVYWIPGLSSQYMRVLYVLWITYLVIKLKVWTAIKGRLQVLLWMFVVFSVYFIWASFYMNDDPFLMTFSQYSMYYVPFAAMLVFSVYCRRSPMTFQYFNKFFGEIILIQIMSGLIKYILFKFHFWEGMVGTFGPVQGGGAGTSFPLVALTWVLVNTNMDIRGWKSWLFVAGLLLVGVAAGKRTVVILFPLFFVFLAMYVAKKRYKRGVLMAILLVPLFFYFGLRLTPSLNPENKVWGSFDPGFALNYSRDYSLGTKQSDGTRGEGNGRIGATQLIFRRISDVDNYSKESWFGNGLSRMYIGDDEKYFDRDYNFGINARGSMTGFVILYLAIGVIGVTLFLIYYFEYFSIMKYWRLRLSVYLLAMYDFILYNAQSIRAPFVAMILIFVMYYSLLQYTPDGKFVGQKHPYFQ